MQQQLDQKFTSQTKINVQTNQQSQHLRASWKEIIPYFFPTMIIVIGFVFERYLNNVLFPLWIAYAIVPILDYILPHDNYNLPEEKLRVYEKDERFLIPIYSAWAADFLIYFYALYLFSTDQVPNSIPMFLLYCYLMANCGGLNLVLGHELVHRKQLIHKILGNLVYAKMTWDLEKTRLEKEGRSAYSLRNKLIFWNLLHVLHVSLIYVFLGPKATMFQIIYSVMNTLIFEAINYIEHYGLQRKQDQNGIYESVNITHSWNAPQVASNYMLIKLQRHSDHHANSYKPYQILESLPASPNLPFGYTGCLIMCYFPKIWFKVMDPYVDSINKGEKLDEKVKKELDTWIFGTLCTIALFVTYVTFFVLGFEIRNI
eukprot:403344302